MFRLSILALFLLGLFLLNHDVQADQSSGSPPLTYELMINGESFLVQADRQNNLKSQDSGATYDVALRIAPKQRVDLNSLTFVYDWPAVVEDDHGRVQRVVKIRHELGYTMLLTDFGASIESDARDKALKLIWESVVEGFKSAKIDDIEVSEPHTHQFPEAEGRGVVIDYRGPQGFDQTCLVYLLVGKEFAAGCVVQYFDRDGDAVLPRVRGTIESIGPLR